MRYHIWLLQEIDFNPKYVLPLRGLNIIFRVKPFMHDYTPYDYEKNEVSHMQIWKKKFVM